MQLDYPSFDRVTSPSSSEDSSSYWINDKTGCATLTIVYPAAEILITSIFFFGDGSNLNTESSASLLNI